MMTNTKVTIFNKYIDNDKLIHFKKHLIEYAFWDDIESVNINKGFEKDNSVVVFIPKDINDLSSYVDPKQYTGETGWTINKGDFIVKGDFIINGDTTATYIDKISELADTNAFTILSVDNKDYGSSNMHHFEIRGK